MTAKITRPVSFYTFKYRTLCRPVNAATLRLFSEIIKILLLYLSKNYKVGLVRGYENTFKKLQLCKSAISYIKQYGIILFNDGDVGLALLHPRSDTYIYRP